MAIIPYLDEVKKIYDLAFTAAVEISVTSLKLFNFSNTFTLILLIPLERQ